MSRDLGHEANPKSANGRLDWPVGLGKPHKPDDPTSIDRTIGLLSMATRQKGNVLGVGRTPAPVRTARLPLSLKPLAFVKADHLC
jgi:hypothetical protein